MGEGAGEPEEPPEFPPLRAPAGMKKGFHVFHGDISVAGESKLFTSARMVSEDFGFILKPRDNLASCCVHFQGGHQRVSKIWGT